MPPPLAQDVRSAWHRHLPGITVALVVFVCGAVFVGWAAEYEHLRRIGAQSISMNPATAVGLVLLAVALWLRRPQGQQARGWHEPLALLCAALVAMTGAARLISGLLPEAMAVDQWLFRDKLAGADFMPNRMAPNTAMCLALLSISLLTLDRRPPWLSQACALFAGLISLLALIGHTYQVRWLYGLAQVMPMAPHSALLLQFLALSILFLRPQRGVTSVFLSATPGGKIARRLLPGMLLAIWLIGWMRLEGERRGWYESELGVALHALANIVLFTGLIWWSVQSLNRSESERQKLALERERFFSMSLDMLCIAGTDGRFKRLNPAFSATLGYPTEELLSRPFLDFVHPDDAPATLAEMERLNRGESVLQFENRYRCKDGGWKWLSWKAQAVAGETVIYATAREVTAQKEAEAANHKLHAELESRARQLEEANHELESFSYSVSHDLRAPLRHVQGYVNLLEKALGQELAERPARYLQTISAASTEMGILIDNLLDFSRMGRAELQQIHVDLNALVRDLLPRLQTIAGDRIIRWMLPELPLVAGDAAMLRQVLANLLENAVKYSRHVNPAEIEVACAGKDADGRLIIFVRDNGAGFDMRYAHKLFGVFQRLHRADEFEGTGIGLAAVRRIIARHGGRVWAEGEPGRGATFFITLEPAPTPVQPVAA
jgi:PAS domain S-box-containing protein